MSWTTFMQTPEDFDQLSDSGFTHWLLEHSRFSLQATSQAEDPGFEQLAEVINLLPAGHSAAFNLDLIALPEDFPEIERLLSFLRGRGVNRIRVQDFGLFHHLHKTTRFDLELDPYTGGSHPAWWELFTHLAGPRLRVMHLPDQLSLSMAGQLQERFPGKVELLACGPLLMYHSRRQLFEGDEVSLEGWTTGRERQRPDQNFRWRTGPHGTLMYHNRWRWLLPLLPAGEELSGIRMLFDWRGAPLNLVKTVMGYYRQPPVDLTEVRTELLRDYGVEFLSPVIQAAVADTDTDTETGDTVSTPYLAVVLHREGKRYLLLQAKAELDLHGEYIFTPPAGEPRTARVRHPRDLNEQPIDRVHAGELFLLDCEAAIVPGSRLEYKDDTAS
jgi:hypothetical protein